MKRLIKFLIFPCLFLMASACTDLEEVLKGDITNDISLPGLDTGGGGAGGDVLEAAFSRLRGTGTANHGSYYSVQTITSDEQCIAAKGGDWFDGGILIELHRHTYAPNHAFINNTWNDHYGAINTCNEFLQRSDLDANALAQVRVLRAYFYMRLMDMFGRVKIVTQPGVDAPQVSRQTVFNFVESELLNALDISTVSQGMDLSSSPLGSSPNPYRINIYGALGILAKVYLNAEVWTGTAMYDKAAIAAGYVIDSGAYALCGDGCRVPNLGRRPAVASDPVNLEGYAAVFAPNNANNQEHIFVVFYDEARAGGMNFAKMNLHYSSQFTYNFQAQPWNGYATLEEFYNSYADGDARKAANFLVGPQLDFGGSAVLDYASDSGELQLNYTPQINELTPNSFRQAGARAAKFSFKQLGRPDQDNDYPIVRLGELYLIRAEAMARHTGNWNNAIPDINVIRARAKVPAYTSLNADEFLRERGREMFQEGLRRTDLIRFGKYNDSWWEKPASQPFRNVFPIPQQQIIASSGSANPLTQNSGY